MPIPVYHAMTSAQFDISASLPPNPAWICSDYFSGAPVPEALPDGSLLIIDDRLSSCGDVGSIHALLSEHRFCGIALDFQKPQLAQNQAILTALEGLGLPVAVSVLYANSSRCGVFLPPVPLTSTLEAHLAPWQGRSLWLEMALDGLEFTVTSQGSSARYLPFAPQCETGQYDPALHCHYSIEVQPDQAVFTLWRTRQDNVQLLEQAQKLGIHLAIGPWQELV